MPANKYSLLHSSNLLLSLVIWLKGLSSPQYLFTTSLFLYFVLLLVNPSNKIIAVLLILAIPLYYWKLRHFGHSIFFAYVTSSLISTGKTYIIQLLAPGEFPIEIFPHGYVLFFTITPSLILATFLGVKLIRDLVLKKVLPIRLSIVDFIVIALMIWPFITDAISSLNPSISLLFDLIAIPPYIVYWYIRLTRFSTKKFLTLFLALLMSQIIFESSLAFQQFIQSSPLFKRIEAQVDIEYFGNVADEIQFRFRPVGTFQHANEFGLWLGFWLVVILSVYFYEDKRTGLLTIILGFGALVATLSRSAWIGFTIASLNLLYIITKKNRHPPPLSLNRYVTPLLIMSLILALFFIVPRAEKSVYTFIEGGGYLREMQIQETAQLIRTHPLLGVGTHMSVVALHNRQASVIFSQVALRVHNWYFLVAAEHGIPYLLLYLLFIFLIFRQNRQYFTRSVKRDKTSFIGIGVVSSLLVLLFIAFFQPFISEPLVLMSSAILSRINHSTGLHEKIASLR